MSESKSDCLIVGGGIGGAVLALALGQNGRRVTIVEKQLHPIEVGRPEILAKSTIDTLRGLGVGERLSEAVIPLKGLEAWSAVNKSLLLSIGESDFIRTQFQPYSTEPNLTRKLILEAAQKLPNVQIQRGVQVHEFIRERGRVAGVLAQSGPEKIELRAPLVVADDGSYSKMRSALGINLKLREFPLLFIAAAGPLLPGQPENTGFVWLNPKKINRGIFGGVFMPQPGQKTAFVLLMSGKAHEHFLSQSPTHFYEAAKNLSPLLEDVERNYKFPEDFHVFKRPFGHSPRYISEGAVLIGDAAHPVTPAGGQGANASVADAISLAHHIEPALENPDLLDECLKAHQEERWPANERSVQISAQANIAFRFGGLCPALLAPVLVSLLKMVNRNENARDRFLNVVSLSFRSRT